MRTVLRIVIALTIACLTAAAVKVGHVITPIELSSLSGDALLRRLNRAGELVLLTATHQSLFVVPLGLIAIAVAETNRIRGWLTYALIGVAIALAGFYLQYVGESEIRTILNSYAAQAYAVEGFVAGSVYWLLAGRFAGWRRGGALVSARPYPLAKSRLQVSDVTLSDTVAASDGKPARNGANG